MDLQPPRQLLPKSLKSEGYVPQFQTAAVLTERVTFLYHQDLQYLKTSDPFHPVLLTC